MDAEKERCGRIVARTDCYIAEDELTDSEGSGVGSDLRDTSKCSSSRDEWEGQRVRTCAIEDLIHVGRHIYGEDSDYD